MGLRIHIEANCPECKKIQWLVLFNMKVGVDGFGCICTVCNNSVVVDELFNLTVVTWDKDNEEDAVKNILLEQFRSSK